MLYAKGIYLKIEVIVNPVEIIIISLLCAAVIAAVAAIIIRKRKGKGCSCGCEHCKYSCPTRQKEAENAEKDEK